MMTIAAISTAPGVGGIAVVRISGPQAFTMLARFVNVPSNPSERLFFSPFHIDGRLVDEVVVSRFFAPHSYTGEDVVEVSCHGSIYVQQCILDAFLQSGARLAEPGEFTRRAFLHGKLDLSQAEAVADLIDSTNEAAHALAVSQLRGGYSQGLAHLRQELVDLTALLELELDFSDEDVEFADRTRLNALLDSLRAEVTRLCDSFRMGNAIKTGIPVAILGRPNVGKSTLLNALLGEDRAIVSDIPGTTRDTIEDSLVIGGFRFRVVDTAGLRQSSDTIESFGIERSIKAAKQAQIILYLVDASTTAADLMMQVDQLRYRVDLQDKHLIVVRTKADCFASVASSDEAILISARTGQGVDLLKQSMLQIVNNHSRVSLHDTQLVSNVRHFDALRRVGEALDQVRQGLDAGLPPDLVVIDIRDALHHLGTITGQVTTDEVLGSIFSRFCIGK